MLKRKSRTRGLALALALATAALIVATTASATRASEHQKGTYVTHNLVSDQPGVADQTDPNLVNAWGLDARPTSPWWTSNNGTDTSTLYNAAGVPFPPGSPLVVKVPGGPTGLVANNGTNFVVSSGSTSAASLFLFSTEEGKILGWNSTVLPTEAIVGADKSAEGAIYKGLAISPAGDRLYATDFHNGKVDVFDGSFNPVNASGAFVDKWLPKGYAPFGIQAVGDKIVVTYAKQDAAREDEVAGRGLGFVDAFDTQGNLLQRVASRGKLNAPWGIALAPADFGRFSGKLLIGNFGDGKIIAYKEKQAGKHEHGDDGGWYKSRGWHEHRGKHEHGIWGWFRHDAYKFVGKLRGADHRPIVIDGLWALQFGKGAANNGPTNTLFFTAGPDDETHGLFGTITAATP